MVHDLYLNDSMFESSASDGEIVMQRFELVIHSSNHHLSMPTNMIQTTSTLTQKWAFPSLEILRSIWNMHISVLALIHMKAFLGALPEECGKVLDGMMRILLQ
jgi:hypothetical protein